MFKRIFRLLFVVTAGGCLASCEKFVEVDPPITRVVSDAVFASNETAIAAVNGLYAQIANGLPITGGVSGISGLLGLAADEFNLSDPQSPGSLGAYFRNQLSTNPDLGTDDFWRMIYSPTMGQINTAIEGLSAATTFEDDNTKSSLNGVVRKQLLAEMQFMRAFCYFYLSEMYGDVPLLLTTNYVVNSNQGRTSKGMVYEQIVKDLILAEGNLGATYYANDVIVAGENNPRIRPIRAAAQALLARVYLYQGNVTQAEQYALKVIDNPLYKLGSLESAFLANNREAIFQLQPVVLGRNTQEAWTFKLPATGPTNVNSRNPVYLNPMLVNSFEVGDLRKISWVGKVTAQGVTYYFPNKYKSATLNDPVTEYSTVLRLAELYLVCAEARAKLGNLSGGDAMLNAIRQRAGLSPITSANEHQLVSAIMHERQVELFTEWGHRWLDLKRTKAIDTVMAEVTPKKGGNAWQSYQQLFPIPAKDMLYNPGLAGHQNIGY